jgi:hypothetical protein
LGKRITVAFKSFRHTFSFVDESMWHKDCKFKVVIVNWLGIKWIVNPVFLSFCFDHIEISLIWIFGKSF